MKNKRFTIVETIKFGFDTTKKNFWFLVIITLINLLVNSLSTSKWEYLPAQGRWDTNFNILTVVFYILKVIIDMGVIRIGLKLYEGKKAQIKDLFSETSQFVNFFLASLIFMVLSGIGFVLLIVPGIIVVMRLQFYSYLIIDQKLGFWEALKKSWEMTRGHVLQLIGLSITYLGIIIVGALALGVGLLVAFPVVALSQVYVFKKLTTQEAF